MGKDLHDFIDRQNIEIKLGLSGEQNGQAISRYEVILRKGEKKESFLILGDSESEQRMTPEDAFRALHSRIRLHETKVELSSDINMLCFETATRLKKFLGPDNYSDFLKL